MNLRYRTLMTVGAVLILILGSIAFFSYFYIEQSYCSLEKDHTIQVVHAIQKTIQDESDYLYANARDYAAWNDTYDFAIDKNHEYITINIRDEVFTLYTIDDFIIFNRSGSLVYAKEYDRISDREVPVPESLIQDIAALNSIQDVFSSDTGSAGIMNSSAGLILVVSHPILTDNFDGPASGSLHFIRRINDDFYQEIAEAIGYNITIISPETVPEDDNLRTVIGQLSDNEPIVTYPADFDNIKGISRISELFNKTSLLLIADVPRSIYHTGHTSVVIFISLLILASGLIIFFVIIFFDKIIFSRLNRIVESVKRNTGGDIASVNRPDGTPDELEELAEAIDPVFYQVADIQARIRKSEEQYRNIFDNIQDLFYRADLDGRIIMMSPIGLQKLGYSSPDDVIGMNVRDLYLNPKDRDGFLDSLETNGSTHNYEIILRSKDNSPLIFHANSHFYHDKEGHIAGIEGVLRDVTELKQAQRELTESKERFRSLVESTSDIIWELNEKGQYSYVSPKIIDILGYHPEDIIGKTPLDSMSPVEAEKIAPFFTSHLDSQLPFTGIETINLHKDGHQMIFETSGVPVIHPINGFTGYRGVTRDITRRKEMEKRFQESEQSYRELFNTIREAIYILDPDGRFITVNDGAALMNGYSRDYFIGKTPEFLSAPGKNDPKIFARHSTLVPDGSSNHFEFWGIRSNGDIFPQEVSLTWGKYFGREVIIGIAMDISERKKTEEALKLSNKKLNLLSNITRHDINNQLQALQVYLDTSVELVNDPVKMNHIIEKEKLIADNLEHQIAFTKDYEDLGVISPIWQNIGSIVKKASNRLSLRNVTILNEVGTIELFADPLLEKVFYNLIQNALNYGGEQMNTIRISASESPGGLTVVMEDNGNGITLEEKQQIFSKGFGKNTGLGLFLSREILSITGISILETGKPGTGARFEITVPKGVFQFSSVINSDIT